MTVTVGNNDEWRNTLKKFQAGSALEQGTGTLIQRFSALKVKRFCRASGTTASGGLI